MNRCRIIAKAKFFLVFTTTIAVVGTAVPHQGKTSKRISLGSNTDLSADTKTERQAFVTLVTTPQYAIGAEVLAKSLRRTGTSRPLVALLGSLVPEEVEAGLEDAGYEILRFQDDIPSPSTHENPWDRPFMNSSYNKIHVFGLYDSFDKVVYLDADVLVLQNIDELFSRDLSQGYPFAAAPDIMPPDYFNTGVMVVRPSKEVYQALAQAAPHRESMDGSDMGFMNAFFPEWFEQSSDHRLPFEYNILQTIATYYTPAWDLLRPGMKVLHFAGDRTSKPWSFAGSIPPSLGVYVYLWQSIARAGPNTDLEPSFEVLNMTDPEAVTALFASEQ